MKARKGAVWTIKRCQQLGQLERLLNEVAILNNGSHVIQRMQLCIKIAESLNAADMNKATPSFVQFLTKICIADRFPK